MIKLTASKRTCSRKSEAKVIRRSGDIPAILYSPGKLNEPIQIKGSDFSAALRRVKKGSISTVSFILSFGNEERRAIVKDIQYEVTTYTVTHLDFEELVQNIPVTVNVPILITGAAESPGIKLGGFLRQIHRTIKVECLPDNIPTEFPVDVKDLSIGHTKRLSDMQFPAGVKPLASMSEVVVVIAKH